MGHQNSDHTADNEMINELILSNNWILFFIICHAHVKFGNLRKKLRAFTFKQHIENKLLLISINRVSCRCCLPLASFLIRSIRVSRLYELLLDYSYLQPHQYSGSFNDFKTILSNLKALQTVSEFFSQKMLIIVV